MGLSEDSEWEWTDHEDTSPHRNGLYQSSSFAFEASVGSPCSASPHASAAKNDGAGSSRSTLVSRFIGMGFPEELVTRAADEYGEDGDESAILETLLTYRAMQSSPNEGEAPFMDEESSSDASFELEEYAEDSTEKDKKLLQLVEMGFLADDASSAIERCGPNASILEMVDSIYAACMAEESYSNEDEVEDDLWRGEKKRARTELHQWRPTARLSSESRGRARREQYKCIFPNPMVGFGLPSDPRRVTRRDLPVIADGPPYFYFENVALTLKGVWDKMSKHLYGVEPEFVDSKYFCAAARKRGYIHNLPIDRRTRLLPIPPQTIQEALPSTGKWWPSWDKRTKLNCLLTSTPTSNHIKRIIKEINIASSNLPHLNVLQSVMRECRRANLVWVGRHKVAALLPGEMEVLLGFPLNHTRGIASETARYKCLGNSFQVDTVAYHLSVLKEIFPHGLQVLSLFSGIGGAEVALHRLGIRLKLVISVEKSETNREVLRAWWAQTEQTGMLIDIADVKQLHEEKLKELIGRYGGFDLIIGGSPCNNLSGSNRFSRHGLEGEHSSLFYDYARIVHFVRSFMKGKIWWTGREL